jgi:hypothetical protein
VNSAGPVDLRREHEFGGTNGTDDTRSAEPAHVDSLYTKIPRGTVIETTQFGISTTSLILRSPATLQMA